MSRTLTTGKERCRTSESEKGINESPVFNLGSGIFQEPGPASPVFVRQQPP